MDRRLHFISGLPRSGSTLLAALLRQNPRFHADMSGPLGGLFGTLLGEMSERNEYAVFLDDAKRQRILAGLFRDFYADCPAEVVFDTNRGWTGRIPALRQLFPQMKVIACVRHVPWIVDSIERLVQRNAFRPSAMFGFSAAGSVYTRANILAGAEGLLGSAYDTLKQGFHGEHAAEHLLIVQYETLVAEPARVLAKIYDFIGEPAFAHDLQRIDFDAGEYDRRMGSPGLHTVRPSVEAFTRQTILPPDLFQRFEHDAFWRNAALNARGVQVI